MRAINLDEPLNRADFLYLRDRSRLPASYLLDENDDTFTDAEKSYARQAERRYLAARGEGSQEVVQEQTSEDEEELDYNEMSKAQLQAELDEREIDYPARAKVADLIELLEQDDEDV